MILCLGTTPAVQRVMVFRALATNGVNRAVAVEDGPAGKAVNVAKVLKALGEEPVAAGFAGGERGRWLREMLETRGIETDFVTVAAQTRECVTLIDQGAGAHLELVEEGSPVSPQDYERLDAVVRRRLKVCRAVVLSGSVAAGGPKDLYFQWSRQAREAGVFCVVDAQGAALEGALKAAPDLVKPNRAELGATLGRELKDEAAVLAAVTELHRAGAQRVVVTAGKDPVLACDGGRLHRITPPVVKAVNPIGSGDAFTAALVWRLLRGEGLGEACRWAAAAGAANALTLMPGEVEGAEVERLAGSVRVEPV